jgi:SAM-dependent methyltransferase
MNADEKEKIIARYNERLQKYGYAPETLGWDKHRHVLRYHILLSLWDATNKSILDFGCGFGDLYGFIKELGIPCTYTGVDINEGLISKGREVYPGARLISADVLAGELPESFDFIFSSGVHNLKLSDPQSFIQQTFDWFAKHARFGFAANFSSARVEYRHDHMYYSDPVKIVELAYRYSNRVVLRNDYMPFEFTVFVDLRTEFDKSVAVYPEFEKFVPRDKLQNKEKK